MKRNFIDIYTRQNYLKWIVLGLSVVIGGGSVLYTNQLINDIKEREYREVSLYARSLEYLAKANDSDELIFILDEVVQANSTIPVILANENLEPEFYKNLPAADELTKEPREVFLQRKIVEMNKTREPVKVTLLGTDGEVIGVKYIYYENSYLLTKLRYYPYLQLLIISVFGFVIFVIFNYSRASEQNRVWVGLAKETAHQLGTPLTALLAWIEYLKSTYPADEHVKELEKDINRLETITARFSSIGSAQKLEYSLLEAFLTENVEYLKLRISQKVRINLQIDAPGLTALINADLFSWVVENLLKNAVDAMAGEGTITVQLHASKTNQCLIDISDTGKGISRNNINQVFKPGFTTKKRGWGLGLTLVKRIVENYHQGKIYVLRTEVNKGTTFRIQLTQTVSQ
ncbi:MAG: signal transduction histidine kinase [Cyclobacteriaceae bacterium]